MTKHPFSTFFRVVISSLFSITSFCNPCLADQVVISPDTVKASAFHSSTATCYGAEANTHINLGYRNSVTGKSGYDVPECTVGGGDSNSATAEEATVSGGGYNQATGAASTVGGGGENKASNLFSTVGGGWRNTASGPYSSVLGGDTNTASQYYSTIGGGYSNTASGSASNVSGGTNNSASGTGATISGGSNNTAAGDYSWAGGSLMKLEDAADHTFVWGHSDSGAQSISQANAFLIFPAGTSGRVGIGTKTPEHTVHATGNNPRLLLEDTASSNPEINFRTAAGTDWAIYKHNASGDLRFYQGGDKLTIEDTTGNVGIGTTDPSRKLSVNGDAGGNGPWNNDSDERLKTNITTITNALEKILALRGVQFEWKETVNHDEGVRIGFIGQETKEVLPEVVTVRNGYYSMQYAPITAVLVEGIKELKAENDRLKTNSIVLKKQYDALKAENNALRNDIVEIKTALGI